MRHIVNWQEIWGPYFSGGALPPLRLRRGLTLHHTANDGPVPLVFEVFADRCYRGHFKGIENGVIVDIGANIGAFTLDYASSSNKAHIHAYEPNPPTNKTLRYNIDSNGLTERVTVYDEAVGRECALFQLWTNVPSLIATGYGSIPPASEAISINVPMIDLNEVVRRAGGSIDLLKVDAEGAEVDILEGATLITLDSIKNIVLEYHDYLCPDALIRCKKVLTTAGFYCREKHDKRNNKIGLLNASRATH